MGAPPKALPCIDLSQFQPMAKMELTRIHQPTIIHLEATTDLGTALPAKSLHVLPSQLPLGDSQGPTIERW
jgi:hypothetical protein